MAIRCVVKAGDPILRERSREVTLFDERLAVLLDDMAETMFKENGCGLAAVQVGVLRRIFVASDDGETVMEFINPVITKQSGSQIFNEGCLSIPDTHGDVKRPKKVRIRAFDRFGKEFEMTADDYLAVIISHENDHLDGVLFTDKVEKYR